MKFLYFFLSIFASPMIISFYFSPSTIKSEPLSHLYLKGLDYEFAKDSPPVSSFQKTAVQYYHFAEYAGLEEFDVKEKVLQFLQDTVSLKSTYSYESFFNEKGAIYQRLSKEGNGGQHVKYFYTENGYLDSTEFIDVQSNKKVKEITYVYNVDTTVCTSKIHTVKQVQVEGGESTKENLDLDKSNIWTDSLLELRGVKVYSMGSKGEKYVSKDYASGVVVQTMIGEKDTINNIDYKLAVYHTNPAISKQRKIGLLRRDKYSDNGEIFMRDEFLPVVSDAFFLELENNNNSLTALDLDNEDIFTKTKNDIFILDSLNVIEKVYIRKNRRRLYETNYNFDEFGNIIAKYKVNLKTNQITNFYFTEYKYREVGN